MCALVELGGVCVYVCSGGTGRCVYVCMCISFYGLIINLFVTLLT